MLSSSMIPIAALRSHAAALRLAGLLGFGAMLCACGGKVIFDGSAAGTGGAMTGMATGTTASQTAAAGTGMTCLTTATVGTGDFGPSPIHGTKCFKPGSSTCPAPATVTQDLAADPCYAITTVDDACVAILPGLCCYDVTEMITCKGG